jgi:predicted nucleic acid-binding protein
MGLASGPDRTAKGKPMKATYNIRSREQIVALHDATVARVAPQMAAMSAARLAAILPRVKATNHVGAGRRAVRDAIHLAAARELGARRGA